VLQPLRCLVSRSKGFRLERKLPDRICTDGSNAPSQGTHNAPMESFWGALKNELVHHRRFATRAEAIAALTEWIGLFSNRHRRQARLGYLSPAAFARQFDRNRRAA
jgi:transposase InsO family protein